MGQSTDAILFYGVPLKEGEIEFREDDDNRLKKGPGWLAHSGDVENGISIGFHCSDGCMMYYAAVDSTIHTAHRGYPERLAISALADAPSRVEREALEAFLTRYKLKVNGTLGWYLCSWWG